VPYSFPLEVHLWYLLLIKSAIHEVTVASRIYVGCGTFDLVFERFIVSQILPAFLSSLLCRERTNTDIWRCQCHSSFFWEVCSTPAANGSTVT